MMTKKHTHQTKEEETKLDMNRKRPKDTKHQIKDKKTEKRDRNAKNTPKNISKAR
jgi:hypothetical protein